MSTTTTPATTSNNLTEIHRAMAHAATLAPSPDNNQPWRFVSDCDRFLVHLDTQRTLPSDVRGMFDLTGLGAAIENACLTAQDQGWSTTVAIHPGQDPADIQDEPIATIRLTPNGQGDPLVDHIAHRATNRAAYSTSPIPEPVLAALTDAMAPSDVRLDWITDRPLMHKMGRLVARCDSIRFQYKPFHQELFHQLRFSAIDAESTRDGLDVRTLALPPGVATALKLLGNWNRMRLLHTVGLGGLLTVPTIWSVHRSGALGAISVGISGIESFVSAGRALQRIWLAATKHGLAIHPLGSLPIYFASSKLQDGRGLSEKHKTLLARTRQDYDQLIPESGDRIPTMLFRIGVARPMKHRSLRRPADEVFTPAR